ncbi:FAD/NAD(P)-binding domain-containing protein [Violaceomyces palustris]|uniref:FAD/NAD(P)-binding domain-containing protein n=1 Tax=Violaceomyces palustris TaxID=1673888 RepID=A0ACD0NP67_9BASI|nr:FAD/NAD(P)-binding domain-containing protein [Violaceomyces palustris]
MTPPLEPVSKGLRRVAIIGGGSAGMSMVQQLHQVDPKFRPTIFERRSGFGGIWRYDPEPGDCEIVFDSRGKPRPVFRLRGDGDASVGKEGGTKSSFQEVRGYPPSPMYEGLRTNIPKSLMAFNKFAFASTGPVDDRVSCSSFPNRSQVEGYLRTFGEDSIEEGLSRFARFDTVVTRVERVSNVPGYDHGSGSVWSVQGRSLKDGKTFEERFDHVVCAGGRCNVPFVPCIPGLENFKGEMMHSAGYRHPERFRGKTVLVVGNSSSGCDVARELSGYLVREFQGSEEWVRDSKTQPPSTGVKVYHSYEDFESPPPLDYDPRDETSPDWCKRIKVVPKISRVEEDGSILLQGGQVLNDVDSIVWGTGYLYDLPYLDHSKEPFRSYPILPRKMRKPSREKAAGETQAAVADDATRSDSGEGAEHDEDEEGTASHLTNLDDWWLFYSADPSLIVLGAPLRIVPFPFTQIQSRFAAAFWSGKVGELGKLDRRIPTNRAERWRSKRISEEEEEEEEDRKVDGKALVDEARCDLGHPSDTAYMESMLEQLPEELRRRDEGWDRVSEWWNEMRKNNKMLRRDELGY